MQQLESGISIVSRKVERGYFIFMAKIDYAFKSKVLNEHSDLLVLTKKCCSYSYANSLMNEYGVVSYVLTHNKGDLMPINELRDICINDGKYDVFNECLKINDASYKRTKRLKDRIASMLLDGECLFLTLTFNDDALRDTTAKQRRVAVSRYLKQFNCKYVANIDFGTKNNREHYHAIINCERVRLDSWRKYGNINVKRVRNRNIDNDKTRLAKYIAKLSNHCIKETTKRSSLLYSR